MGFFSWDCKVCGHPMLSFMATTDRNRWMSQVVVIEHDGSILKGEYDGYGRVGDHEMDTDCCLDPGCEPQCYHRACWELVGKPADYEEGSESSADQGWFFDDKAHYFKKPKTLEEAQQMRPKVHISSIDFLKGKSS